MEDPKKLSVTINPENLDQVKCSACNSKEFVQYTHIFLASAIVSPTGKELSVISPKGFVCVNCGGLDTMKVEKKEKDKVKLN